MFILLKNAPNPLVFNIEIMIAVDQWHAPRYITLLLYNLS